MQQPLGQFSSIMVRCSTSGRRLSKWVGTTAVSAAAPDVFALDFDGVIVDSEPEVILPPLSRSLPESWVVQKTEFAPIRAEFILVWTRCYAVDGLFTENLFTLLVYLCFYYATSVL
jgi:hypothetical protein